MTEKVNIDCPHCGASIQYDKQADVVVSHEAPVHLHQKADFDERLEQLGRDKAKAADRMEEAMRREKDKSRLMDERFKELFDDTKKKDDGSKPIKDIDLD